jgi:hypothetical protein
MECGKSRGFATSIGDLIAAIAATMAGGGNTKAIEVTSERSESWQQDMEQAIIPGISCPQSI